MAGYTPRQMLRRNKYPWSSHLPCFGSSLSRPTHGCWALHSLTPDRAIRCEPHTCAGRQGQLSVFFLWCLVFFYVLIPGSATLVCFIACLILLPILFDLGPSLQMRVVMIGVRCDRSFVSTCLCFLLLLCYPPLLVLGALLVSLYPVVRTTGAGGRPCRIFIPKGFPFHLA
jgi:hypothetical protein